MNRAVIHYACARVGEITGFSCSALAEESMRVSGSTGDILLWIPGCALVIGCLIRNGDEYEVPWCIPLFTDYLEQGSRMATAAGEKR